MNIYIFVDILIHIYVYIHTYVFTYKISHSLSHTHNSHTSICCDICYIALLCVAVCCSMHMFMLKFRAVVVANLSNGIMALFGSDIEAAPA